MTGKRGVRASLLISLLLLFNMAGLHRASGQSLAAQVARPAAPLAFEPNVGQTDPRARYVARSRGYTVFVTSDGPIIALRGSTDTSAVRLRCVGGAQTPAVTAVDELPGRTNYLAGADRSKWRTD